MKQIKTYNRATMRLNDAKAIQDIKDYLNDADSLKKLTAYVIAILRLSIKGRIKIAKIHIGCNLMGISGYPVKAFRRHCLKILKGEQHDNV